MTDQRQAFRHKIILPAYCWTGDRAEFHAVTDEISAAGIHFRSAGVAILHESLTCNIRFIGRLTGRVIQSAKDAFVIRVAAERRLIDSVMRELVLLSSEQQYQTRLHPRVKPSRPDVAIQLADGRILPGRLLDVSASGVALTLAEPLEIGTVIRVGRTSARIIRHFEGGLGAAFLEPLDPRVVKEDMAL